MITLNAVEARIQMIQAHLEEITDNTKRAVVEGQLEECLMWRDELIKNSPPSNAIRAWAEERPKDKPVLPTFRSEEELAYALEHRETAIDGSNPEETAKRELREEAGCVARKLIYLGNTQRSKWATGRLHFFLAKEVEQKYEQELEYAEDIKVSFVDFKDFKRYFEAGEIHDVASVSCFAFVLNYIQKYEKKLGL